MNAIDNIKFVETDSRAARLANVRIVVEQDTYAKPPYAFMQQVFVPADKSVDWLNGDDSPIAMEKTYHGSTFTCKFCTTERRLDELFNHDRNTWTVETLEKIWVEESNLIDDWENDRVFELTLEEWNEDERKFEYKETLICYRKADVAANLVNFAEQYKSDGDVVFCIDEDLANENGIKIEK